LGMTVSEAKCSIPATEFIRWCAKLDKEWTTPKRGDLFLANIAWQLERILIFLGAGNKKAEFKDFLWLNKESPAAKLKAKKVWTRDERRARKEAKSSNVAASKAAWLGFARLSKKVKNGPGNDRRKAQGGRRPVPQHHEEGGEVAPVVRGAKRKGPK
jgi:hypothetical protein